MSSWRQAFMTEYEPEVKEKKFNGSEKHHNADCKYVRREAMKNDKRVFYWIRNCSCGKENDHSSMLNVPLDSLNKEEGVEMHLKEDCQWILRKQTMILGIVKKNSSKKWKRKCVCRQYRSARLSF